MPFNAPRVILADSTLSCASYSIRHVISPGGSVSESVFQGTMGEASRLHRPQQRAVALPSAAAERKSGRADEAQVAHAGKQGRRRHHLVAGSRRLFLPGKLVLVSMPLYCAMKT